MTDRVVHDSEGHRYVLLRGDEELGESVYRAEEGALRFLRTEIDPSRREGGLGTALVRGALDQVRSETGLRVIPDCPFVRRFIEKHAEYQDLLTR